MADNGAAQNKLGQLYVDLGLGGIGKFLGGLNKISAQFLLTKNAAQQALKPIDNLFGTHENKAIQIEKINTALGGSVEMWAKVDRWSKKHVVDLNTMTGLYNSFANLQQKINIGGFAFDPILQRAGFDDEFIRQLQGQKNPFATLDLIAKKLKPLFDSGDIQEITKVRMALADLGLNAQDIMWVMKESNGNLVGAIEKENAFTEKEIENLEDLKKATEDFKSGLDVHIGKILSEFAPEITSVINGVKNELKKAEPSIKNLTKTILDHLPSLIEFLAQLIPILEHSLPIIATVLKNIAELFTGHDFDTNTDKTYTSSLKNVIEGKSDLADKAIAFNPFLIMQKIKQLGDETWQELKARQEANKIVHSPLPEIKNTHDPKTSLYTKIQIDPKAMESVIVKVDNNQLNANTISTYNNSSTGK